VKRGGSLSFLTIFYGNGETSIPPYMYNFIAGGYNKNERELKLLNRNQMWNVWMDRHLRTDVWT
jgi:hypothetical protein